MEEIDNGRWNAAQVKEDGFWKRSGVIDSEMGRVLSRYAPIIRDISSILTGDARILDVGCGPTCAGRLFERGKKTFLDPLMESYKEMDLPEGEKISVKAENIPFNDGYFDVILSVNALDHMLNPAAALKEISRTLKDDGIFMLGIFLHPAPIAAIRLFIERWLPILREDAHPYSYTLKTIRKELSMIFDIKKEVCVYRKDSALIPSLHREDWVFICNKLK